MAITGFRDYPFYGGEMGQEGEGRYGVDSDSDGGARRHGQ